MSCVAGCSNPGRWSPEFKKVYKAENTAGCCCNGSGRNDCEKPSLARPGSPLWEWEKNHGKLITKIIHTQDDQGHTITRILKTTCPIKTERPSRFGCCSLTYRTSG